LTSAGLLSGSDDVTTNTNTGTISEYVSAKDQYVDSSVYQHGGAYNELKVYGNHNDIKENEDWKATNVQIGSSYATGVQSIKTGDKYTKVYAPDPKYTKPSSRAHKSGKRGKNCCCLTAWHIVTDPRGCPVPGGPSHATCPGSAAAGNGIAAGCDMSLQTIPVASQCGRLRLAC
jgi:hypothetical protein